MVMDDEKECLPLTLYAVPILRPIRHLVLYAAFSALHHVVFPGELVNWEKQLQLRCHNLMNMCFFDLSFLSASVIQDPQHRSSATSRWPMQLESLQ